MALSFLYVIVTGLVTVALIMTVLLTAPNLSVGTRRLRSVMRVLCLTVERGGYMISLVMLVWGVITRSESLMYFSMMPLAVALLTYGFMRRSGI